MSSMSKTLHTSKPGLLLNFVHKHHGLRQDFLNNVQAIHPAHQLPDKDPHAAEVMAQVRVSGMHGLCRRIASEAAWSRKGPVVV